MADQSPDILELEKRLLDLERNAESNVVARLTTLERRIFKFGVFGLAVALAILVVAGIAWQQIPTLAKDAVANKAVAVAEEEATKVAKETAAKTAVTVAEESAKNHASVTAAEVATRLVRGEVAGYFRDQAGTFIKADAELALREVQLAKTEAETNSQEIKRLLDALTKDPLQVRSLVVQGKNVASEIERLTKTVDSLSTFMAESNGFYTYSLNPEPTDRTGTKVAINFSKKLKKPVAIYGCWIFKERQPISTDGFSRSTDTIAFDVADNGFDAKHYDITIVYQILGK